MLRGDTRTSARETSNRSLRKRCKRKMGQKTEKSWCLIEFLCHDHPTNSIPQLAPQHLVSAPACLYTIAFLCLDHPTNPIPRLAPQRLVSTPACLYTVASLMACFGESSHVVGVDAMLRHGASGSCTCL
jgi:hypothetical protein